MVESLKKKKIPFPIGAILIVLYDVLWCVYFSRILGYLREQDFIIALGIVFVSFAILIRKPNALLSIALIVYDILYILPTAVSFFGGMFEDGLIDTLEWMGSSSLWIFVYLSPWIILTIASFSVWTDNAKFPKLKIALIVICSLLSIRVLFYMVNNFEYYDVINFVIALSELLQYLGIILTYIWFEKVYKLRDLEVDSLTSKAKTAYGTSGGSIAHGDYYIGMGGHVAMLFFIGFVWLYVWIYKATKFTNNAKGFEYRNPTTKLLLNMFVPFYFIYWCYETAKRTDAMAKEKGISSDISTLSLVLAIFIGIVPPIIIQSKLNEIATCKVPARASVSVPAHTAEIRQPEPNVNSDVSSQLRNLKELLDDGLITQEDYDAKKKKLLGL